MKVRVETEKTLGGALARIFAGMSRREMKRRLAQGRVIVNGEPVRSIEAPVSPGDLIEVRRTGGPIRLRDGVALVFEDADIAVVEKPVGLLTSGPARDRRPTALQAVEEHLRRQNPRAGAFPCHRLDRDASGLLLVAKSRAVQGAFRKAFGAHVERTYAAIVEGTPAPGAGTLRSFLRDGPDQVVRSSGDPAAGKLAVTEYRVTASGRRWSAVEVRLETGRKHQIRVHFAENGHPVAGDKKYGAKTDPIGRLALHAVRLKVKNPLTGREVALTSNQPWDFGCLGDDLESIKWRDGREPQRTQRTAQRTRRKPLP